MTVVDDRLLGIFVEEARDLARRLLSTAVQLEQSMDDEERQRHMADILRDLHTMKGSAGSVATARTKQIAKTVHEVEDRLKAAGPGAGEDAALLDYVIDVLTAIQESVEHLAAGDLEAGPDVAEEASPASSDTEDTAIADGVFLFTEDDEAAPSETTSAPSAVPKASKTDRRTAPGPDRQVEPLKIRPERIDAAHDVAAELVVSRLHTEALTADLTGMRERVNATAMVWRGLMGDLRQARRTLGASWVSIEPKVLALQANLNDIRQDATILARRSTSIRDRQGALIGTLDERIRSLRMMPVQPFLEELLPVAREAGKLAGRRVRLVPDGGDAEVDRQVLVMLREPLLHMVRNAVVHGVEPAEERRRLGKPEVGTITLTARCEGPRIRLCVSDDGRGIDVDRLLDRGKTDGLVPLDAVGDPATVLRILLAPGVSTAQKVDGLAGRGVGMDVVHETIEQLNGSLDLEWEPGQGSMFTIDVPITTSTTAGLVVVVGSGRFGLPLSHVERVVRITRSDLVGGESHPFVRIDGEPVAAAPLGPFVGQSFEGLGKEKIPAIVLMAKGVRLALLVDDIAGQREMLVKALPAAFASHGMLVGGAVEADGSVLQVLNAPAVVQRVEREGIESFELLEDAPRPEVLVVDRSRPMQSLLRGVLTGGGFAFAGVSTVPEARAAMADRTFELVVLDPRIPEADAFCDEVQQLEDPPKLVVMSFDVEAGHRGLEAGAAAFVDKHTFTGGGFLDVAREQVGVA